MHSNSANLIHETCEQQLQVFMSTPSTIHKEKPKSSKQSEEKETYKTELLQLFQKAKSQRDRAYKHFNGKTLLEYIETNHSLSMGYVEDIEVEEWQSNTSTNLIRNKFIAVLAFLLEQLIQPEVSARNGKYTDARAVARDIEEVLHEQMDKNKYFQKYLDILIEAVGQGTVFVDTGYRRTKRDIKDIESFDPDTGKVKYKKKTITDYEGLFLKIIPVHEMYLGNMFVKDMKDQPFIFRRTVMDYFEAKAIYGNYPEFEKVNPWTGATTATDDQPDYKLFDQSDLVAGEAEVIIYQCRISDEMAIMVNGVLITEVGDPLPYDHKDYTVAKGVFNPFPDTEIAYGKSLAQEQMFNQEVADTLINMIVDRSYLSLFRPLLTEGREEVTSDIIVPGSNTNVTSDTKISAISGVGEPVTQAEIGVFQLIQNLQEQATPQQAGNASSPEGGAVAATQVLAQQQDAIRLMGLFGFTISFLIEDIMRLWMPNILQFEFTPEMNEKRELVYRSYFLKGRQVFDNKRRGVLEVRLSPVEEFPSKEQVYKEEEQYEKEAGEPKMIRYLDPELIRDYEMVVKVQANPNPRGSKMLERAQEEQFFTKFINDPYMNQEQIRRGLVELYDKDPEDYLVKQTEREMAMAEQQQQGQGGSNQINAQISSPINQANQQPSLNQLVNS